MRDKVIVEKMIRYVTKVYEYCKGISYNDSFCRRCPWAEAAFSFPIRLLSSKKGIQILFGLLIVWVEFNGFPIAFDGLFTIAQVFIGSSHVPPRIRKARIDLDGSLKGFDGLLVVA